MKIQYKGTIINGHGAHSGLGVPGRSNLQNVPDDWPKVLAQGSLNILVSSSGYPDLYNRLGIPSRVSMLDTGFFDPEFTIEQAQFDNNQITPTEEKPQNGTGQVWRATLFTESNEIKCWMLRRIGSGLQDQIELISHEEIRTIYGLNPNKNWPAIVEIEDKQCAT